MLAAWVNLAHLVSSCLGKEGHKTMHQTRDSRVAHPEQEAEHFMGGVDSQPDQAEQELVAYRQGEGVSSAWGTLTERALPVVTLLLGTGIEWEHIVQKGGKLREFQAADGQKHSWIAL